jgi:hypothetical protein
VSVGYFLGRLTGPALLFWSSQARSDMVTSLANTIKR